MTQINVNKFVFLLEIALRTDGVKHVVVTMDENGELEANVVCKDSET